MLILGVDPGIASVGYCVVNYERSKFRAVEFDTFVTKPHQPLETRLLQIHQHIESLFARYPIDSMAVEELFFSKNVSNGIQVGHARGVILLAAASHGISVGEYTPMQVKQAVTGYGKADKKQVQYMIKTIFHLAETPKPDDTADALAVAVCHGHYAGSRVSNIRKT